MDPVQGRYLRRKIQKIAIILLYLERDFNPLSLCAGSSSLAHATWDFHWMWGIEELIGLPQPESRYFCAVCPRLFVYTDKRICFCTGFNTIWLCDVNVSSFDEKTTGLLSESQLSAGELMRRPWTHKRQLPFDPNLSCPFVAEFV
jgi:hypothetical protein